MSHLMPPEPQEKFHSSLKAGGWQGVWETLQPGQVNLTLVLCHLCHGMQCHIAHDPLLSSHAPVCATTGL
jgi:hypothetical protein